MPSPTISESARSIGSSFSNLFGGLFRPGRISPDQFRGLTAPGLNTSPPRRGLANLPANYRGDELQLAARASAQQILMGGSGAGGSVGGGNMGGYVPLFTSRQAPADRAYQQEKARVAQMTEQDPMFKKYQVAELSKQYNAAKGDEREKIGMQIWAQTNPELAAKLRPGATGYSDVATAFQKLSPVGNFAGSMAPSNFTMPAVDSNTMPTVEQAFGVSAPQFNIPGMDTSSMTTAVAPGAFSQPLSTDITKYLTDPVKAYAPTEKVDQTKLALLRQAYNQRFK